MGEDFIREWKDTARYLEENQVYSPEQEHSSCGVGLVAAIDGKPRRQVVEAGIEALRALWHRGAVDADGKTGDGAGIHVQIPQDFFKGHIRNTGHEPSERRLAVGMIFLPRTDYEAQERCRAIVESEVLRFGHTLYGWRQVPTNNMVIGDKANATRPEIEQVMIANNRDVSDPQFELDLYIIRRRIEKHIEAEGIQGFYICSLSCRSIIYKGLFLAEQLTAFYPDLLDERFVSAFAIYHQRYSTNTFPSWSLAQPFRVIAHNGEINTLRGNRNWMAAHEARLQSDRLGDAILDVVPVIPRGASDSAALDSVFELMARASERSLPMIKTLLIPDAWEQREAMPAAHKAMFSYCSSVMEPWDGPAAVCGFGGRWVVAGMDRNGLRPLRYTITGDGLLIVGSETGMVRIDESAVVKKGRVGPGESIAVDLKEGKLYYDQELRDRLAATHPFEDWVKNFRSLDEIIAVEHEEPVAFDSEELRRRQLQYAWSMEELELVLQPMVEDGKEPIGSMGDDTPIAVLSDKYRGVHHFFRQNFAQVTNPPIDSLRESAVMTLSTRLGTRGNILSEDEGQCDLFRLDSPVLTNAEFDALHEYLGDSIAEIDCTFDPSAGEHALSERLDEICRDAEDAVRGGAVHVVLSDRNCGPNRAPVPMVLAAGGVHSHLIRQSLRTFSALHVRSGECLDVHYFAVLIGVGATTVNAYLAQEAIADRHARGLFDELSLADCLQRYKAAVNAGLLKVMSKMGISVLSSYRGGYNFEAIGLSRTLINEFFPGMSSRISGIGLTGIQHKVTQMHAKAWDEDVVTLPVGGFYRYRRGGEAHAFQANSIHTLQAALEADSFGMYQRYLEQVREQPPVNLRDLLDFQSDLHPVGSDEVESITEIRKRLVAPGISLGALSPEAHETLSIAMNRIGAKSDSGEGGEDSARYKPKPNGDNASSAIKQVASGRFGVTAEYLNNCRELEIKIAQGAKPGEGGQLPGFKVSGMIAKLRHSTPGVTLISPPPHHDIYSIEDLAQLIYDLKQINPEARVCVKLVAQSGIGTVAAGVAKAHADTILISGHAGGTGASPQSSIKFAGLPWELGLSEVHQVLTLNRLRHRVKLRVDGGIKTGRDIVIAAMLGGEEFGVGTASLIAMGCIMVRQCHSNTCPVGVCTQDERLREKFVGTPEKVVNLFTFLAEEVREILAQLGFHSLDEVVGRSDLLHQVSRGNPYLDDLDLNPILVRADAGDYVARCTTDYNEVPETLDAQMIEDAEPLFRVGEKMQLAYGIRNTQRAIGAKISSKITRQFGMKHLAPGHLTARLRGSAGQSLGAFAVQGVKLEVLGDANDYCGKGLSGGTIMIRPPTSSPLITRDNAILGNVALYGATDGKLFAAGLAGDRFCVRNSGAVAVVEGCGSNGCEYMTGGTTVILGPVGDNFGAGMTGGMAFVYDRHGEFERRVNPDSITWQRVEVDHWEHVLRGLIAEHVRETQSAYAGRILDNWDRERDKFWQIVPRDMLDKLAHPVRSGAVAAGGAAE
ncbi:MAG: glutamate synthase large subunit [Alphaproteobacteria bacterium]